MSNKGKDLMQCLRDSGLDGYGSVIPGELVRSRLDITLPKYGTYEEFQAASLEELDAIGYVRKVLLQEGKYLRGDRGSYRILLPSENAAQILKYMEEADRKIKRGLILSRTTPTEHKAAYDDTEARAHMRQVAIRDSKLFGRSQNPTTPLQ